MTGKDITGRSTLASDWARKIGPGCLKKIVVDPVLTRKR